MANGPHPSRVATFRQTCDAIVSADLDRQMNVFCVNDILRVHVVDPKFIIRCVLNCIPVYAVDRFAEDRRGSDFQTAPATPG